MISGFSIVIHIRIHYHFSTLFSPSLVSGPRSAKFLPPGFNLYFRHWKAYAENAVVLFIVQGARQFGVNNLSHCQVFWAGKEVDEKVSRSYSTSLFGAVWFLVLVIAERAVKANRKVVNQRLLIALNGTETANYDFRPAHWSGLRLYGAPGATLTRAQKLLGKN